MLRICSICKKSSISGKTLVRKGLAKKKGGTGSKVARRNNRIFLPNLQKIRILVNGSPKRCYVCSKCIKKGRIQKV